MGGGESKVRRGKTRGEDERQLYATSTTRQLLLGAFLSCKVVKKTFTQSKKNAACIYLYSLALTVCATVVAPEALRRRGV